MKIDKGDAMFRENGPLYHLGIKMESDVAIARLCSKLNALMIGRSLDTRVEAIQDAEFQRVLTTVLTPPVHKKLLPLC